MKKLLSILFALCFIYVLNAQPQPKVDPNKKEDKKDTDKKPEDKKPEDKKPENQGQLAPKDEDQKRRPLGILQMSEMKPDPKKNPVPEGTPWIYQENFFDLDLEQKAALAKRIQWKATFWTSYNYFNNSDLRYVSEQNETAIQNTDDKISFVVGGAELDMFFPIHPRLDFRVDIFRVGFWGHDQLGGRDSNNDIKYTRNGANTVNYGNLYFDSHIILNPTAYSKGDLRVGRQPYEIGGQIQKDYYLDDTLDAVTFRWYGKFGKLDLLLLDVYSSGANPQDVYFVQYISFDDEKVDGFDGDVNTYRYGANYAFPFIGHAEEKDKTHLEARAFIYFARYGGLNDGGSDRTNKGTSGNFPDNDFSYMRGVRLNAGFRGYVRLEATYAESYGTDRKRPTIIYTSQDVDNNGQSLDLQGEIALFGRWLLITPSVFWSEGGKYNADGTQYSHGFVGFKGDHAGGMLTDLNWGYYPSAYVDDDGIDDTPFERQRKSGTFERHLGVAVGKPDFLYVKVDWYRLEDTNSVSLFNSPKPGFSTILTNKYIGPSIYEQQIRLELARAIYPTAYTALSAYRRFSAPMGEEVDIGIDWTIVKNWRFWATMGVFKPMRYYATSGLEQGTPEGSARFTGFQMGTTFYF